ncbi:hypothetical protein NCCP691_37240 [Noviherbaspirillum aridicola]|uniref:PAS domain S-box-containing protein/diguanylate cyclase (GGDEF)-like protein n=2 Tax=Noviherbaspirillum aridicola TaxID=2849687 RepID=A0ABQ4QAB0_9BURK|nr:hypothetical protein NCCP691_37240 [Noviherbaspirillum aridicola]
MSSRLLEFRVRNKEGHYIWVGANIRVLIDPLTGEKLGSVVVSRDIQAQRDAREELIRSEARFRSLTNLSSDWFWETDEQGRFTYVSDGLYRLFGIRPEEVIGRTRTERAADRTEPGLLEYLAKVERREPFRDLPYSVFVPEKGTIGCAALSGEPIYDGNRFIGYRGVGRDITDSMQAQKRLQDLANHDALTGLPNRAHLSERLRTLLDNCGSDDRVAVLFIDLDRFKEVNDTLGHARGDELLSEVAQRLRQSIAASDIVARLGGDEFVVVSQCINGAQSAMQLVEKLRYALDAPIELAAHEVFVRSSIGISMFPQDGRSEEDLLQHADIAMYRAKEEGRNGYRFYTEEMGIQVRERMTIDNSLHRALERNEFELYYQPKFDLSSLRVVGMEALIRWNHPQLGRVSPLDFIPMAEERGFISEIGKWVLEEACRFTARLMAAQGQELKVSVNLSARQVQEGLLIRHVVEALERSALTPGSLELELTETAMIANLAASADVFTELKSLGVSLAVDDFGTGYSGLAYLGQLPFDVLKLDRSFINQKEKNGLGNRKIIRAFIRMAQSLNLSVVAEGVETSEILSFLREVGCNEAQGYLFSRPLPADEFETFIATHEARLLVL